MNPASPRRPFRLPIVRRLLLTAFVIGSPVSAQDAARPGTVIVKDFLGKDRVLNDLDRDGWDDLSPGTWTDVSLGQ